MGPFSPADCLLFVSMIASQPVGICSDISRRHKAEKTRRVRFPAYSRYVLEHPDGVQRTYWMVEKTIGQHGRVVDMAGNVSTTGVADSDRALDEVGSFVMSKSAPFGTALEKIVCVPGQTIRLRGERVPPGPYRVIDVAYYTPTPTDLVDATVEFGVEDVLAIPSVVSFLKAHQAQPSPPSALVTCTASPPQEQPQHEAKHPQNEERPLDAKQQRDAEEQQRRDEARQRDAEEQQRDAETRQLADEAQQREEETLRSLDEAESALAAQLAHAEALRRSRIRHVIRGTSLRHQPRLDAEQVTVKTTALFDGPLVVQGGPGTGKTTTLLDRLLFLTDPAIGEHTSLPQRTLTRLGDPATDFVLFTPNDLLADYVRDAMSLKGLPNDARHLRTWKNFREDLALKVGLTSSDSSRSTFQINRPAVRADAFVFKADKHPALFRAFRDAVALQVAQRVDLVHRFDALALDALPLALPPTPPPVAPAFSLDDLDLDRLSADVLEALTHPDGPPPELLATLHGQTESDREALRLRQVAYEAAENTRRTREQQARRVRDTVSQLLRRAQALAVPPGRIVKPSPVRRLVNDIRFFDQLASTLAADLRQIARESLPLLRETTIRLRARLDTATANDPALAERLAAFYNDRSTPSASETDSDDTTLEADLEDPNPADPLLASLRTLLQKRALVGVSRNLSFSKRETDFWALVEPFLDPFEREALAAPEIARRITALARGPLANVAPRIASTYRTLRRKLPDGPLAPFWTGTTPPHEGLAPDELDLLLCLTLWLGRGLIRANDPAPTGLAEVILAFRRAVVAVDEGPDFSAMQLACMALLSDPAHNAITVSGDLLQRMTSHGLQSWDDLHTMLETVDIRPTQRAELTVSYRQSERLLQLIRHIHQHATGRPASAKSAYEPSSDDPAPLVEIAPDEDTALRWLAGRIVEARTVYERNAEAEHFPSIAVFVPTSDRVGPVADALEEALPSVSVLPCPDGKSFGRGSHVRVFPVDCIKGLEFEAAFFFDFGATAQAHPDIASELLYVGLSRASLYLALTLIGDPPASVLPLLAPFESGKWLT